MHLTIPYLQASCYTDIDRWLSRVDGKKVVDGVRGVNASRQANGRRVKLRRYCGQGRTHCRSK